MLSDANFWLLISFAIFVAGILVFARNKILQALADRAGVIREDLERARRLHQEAQILLAQQQCRVDDVALESQKIITRGHEQAESLRKTAAAELRGLIHRREKQADDRIKVAKAEAVTTVRTALIDLTFATSEQILAGYGQSVDESLLQLDTLAEQLRGRSSPKV